MRQDYFAQRTRYKSIATAFMMMVLAYLLFHLFLSERSIPALVSLSMQQTAMQSQVALLDDNHAKLLDRVTRLRPETLDPDLVDEYAIEMLGHGTRRSIVLVDNQKS